jgi:hypothetical protein
MHHQQTPTIARALAVAHAVVLALALTAAIVAQEEPESFDRITFSQPLPTPGELARWNQLYRSQFAPVEISWARLLHRLSGDQPRRFSQQCDGLRTSLAQIDPASLLPAPDRLIDLYVRRMLLHLDAAGEACYREQIFNVVYRLEEARGALAEVRWLLSRQSLE